MPSADVPDRQASLTCRNCAALAVVLGVALVLGAGLWLTLPDAPAAHAAGAVPTPALEEPFPMPPELQGVELMKQTDQVKLAKSAGCVVCHQNTGDPHAKETVRLGCVDCHGGDPTTLDKHQAHVAPRFPEAWRSSANPVRSYTLLNHESPEFIRFVNPGDLRIAHISCGTSGCHTKEVYTNRKQIMATGAMLWGAALYNNGSVPFKRARFGECYAMCGVPLRVQTVPPPSAAEMRCKGVVPFLDPLPRFENSQPGNVLRIFEQGGRFRAAEVGIPQRLELPGKPLARLSDRGLGTINRTDPVFIGLNKTRLFDPTLNFLGTNDHPGDFYSSGCSACHFVYANDSSPVHSGPFAKFGNRGLSANPDPTIPRDEPGHPIEHRFRTGIPTSQCMVCHIHPGTSVMNSYLGYLWWDEETEGHLMYPPRQKYPTPEQWVHGQMSNPDEAALRGNWSDPAFLANVTRLNPQADKLQFADFHGHGWVFRAIYKRDRQGRLLDHAGHRLVNVTPQHLAWATEQLPLLEQQFHRQRFDDAQAAAQAERELDRSRAGMPVHLRDIHLEKGMHCVDCHFVQDVHGNGRLQMEVRAACEIQCIDCHGTITQRATLRTTGPAAYTSSTDPQKPGRDLAALRTPFGKPRFEREGERLFQNSVVEPGLRWEVVQVLDTITPGHPRYNASSRLAKTVRFEGDRLAWGDVPREPHCLAHDNDNLSCMACHSSWNPSCYGCHLPQRANVKMPHLHWDGDVTRNYTSYDFQTLRDDIYMLARDGDVTGNRIGPARSSCAIHVTSYNANREAVYLQQQTISAEGYGGTAFSSNVPHTVRGKGETRRCTDCHISRDNDNNAWMAQLLMHGTNYLNWVGRFCWVAAGAAGLAGVAVTEQEEPQAVIGSTLHALAFPDFFRKHVERDRRLEVAHRHPGIDIGERLTHPLRPANILQVQARGEYLYAACGADGVRVFDIAFVEDKGFSQRISTAPVSPLGQQFYVQTRYATSVAAPSTVAVDPSRVHFPENREQPIHPLFGYLYITDRDEGLILVGAATTINGNPVDNFLKRAVTFNPDGILNGARSLSIVGTYAYICCDAGLVVVSLNDPLAPHVTNVVDGRFLKHPKMVQVQFRYAYVVDDEGIKVLDVTHLEAPLPVSSLRLDDARSIYLARTYAYVAAGKHGLVILDITRPEHPVLDQWFDAGGCLNDVHDVKLGITYVSEFAYVADGKNGLRVVQLTSPDTPGNYGFSPRPTPQLIATWPLPHGGKALGISKGLDRDRAVDECGNQIGVFGRVGARPLSGEEQRRLYLHHGQPWRVSDDPEDRQIYPPPRDPTPR
jgi:hypothetical protein